VSFVTGPRVGLKKIQDYLRHAAECREMAQRAPPVYKQQLEQMAETWEALAEVRRHDLEQRETFPGDKT